MKLPLVLELNRQHSILRVCIKTYLFIPLIIIIKIETVTRDAECLLTMWQGSGFKSQYKEERKKEKEKGKK